MRAVIDEIGCRAAQPDRQHRPDDRVGGDPEQEPGPLRGFNLTRPACREAVQRGIAFSMLPKEYGGGGLSNVDFVVAAEEICAVDPRFATTILVNGLGLMPVWYYGTEVQKQRFITAATADTSGEFIVGYAASEPAGTPGGTANLDAPASGGSGMAVTAHLDGDDYIVNGRKYWPCNVGGWDNQGANHHKVFCTELLMDSVYKCMQVVGVNSVDRKHRFERYLREAAILALYDAGNFGMQRRRIHGVMAHSAFDPRPS